MDCWGQRTHRQTKTAVINYLYYLSRFSQNLANLDFALPSFVDVSRFTIVLLGLLVLRDSREAKLIQLTSWTKRIIIYFFLTNGFIPQTVPCYFHWLDPLRQQGYSIPMFPWLICFDMLLTKFYNLMRNKNFWLVIYKYFRAEICPTISSGTYLWFGRVFRLFWHWHHIYK